MLSDELITRIQLAGALPTDDPMFQSAGLLSIMNDLLQDVLAPELGIMDQNHLTYAIDFPGGSSELVLPSRSVAGSIRKVVMTNNAGDPYILFQETLTNLDTWWGNASTATVPAAYLLRLHKLIFLPMGATSPGVVTIYFDRRPNDLVLTEEAGVVESFDLDTGEVTLTSASPTFTVAQGPFDFIGARDPYISRLDDAVMTDATGAPTYVFDELPTDMAVGDYVCLARQSPVPQVPDELHSWLMHAAIAECMATAGDTVRHDSFAARATAKLERFRFRVSPRSGDRPVKLVPRFSTRRARAPRHWNVFHGG